MKNLVKAYKGLPWLVKLILCIPVLEIANTVVRLMDGIVKKDILKIVVSVLCIIPGAAFMWIVDLVWVLLYHKHFWL